MTPIPSREPDEFGIQISYEPHRDAPARVFQTMTALIEAFQEIDTYLANSLQVESRPVTLLEDIEAGSLRVWLRNILTEIPDKSLESGDWKKVLGAFLVKAKRIMITWTEDRTTVTSETELTTLQKALLDEAIQTGALSIPAYRPVPTSEIARSVELIANATGALNAGESVTYLTGSEPPVEFNRAFQVVPDSLAELLVHESLVNEAQMILIIKKPDFLGDSRWEFRHGKTPLPAKLVDPVWLAEFRSGLRTIRPGDALRARVKTTAHYGLDGDVVDLQHEVVHVDAIITVARPAQDPLFDPGTTGDPTSKN